MAAFAVTWEAHVVDRNGLAEIALRYDTSMSRAMLRALGISPAYRRMRASVLGSRPAAGSARYRGCRAAMRQHHGVRVREQTYAEERAMVRRRNAGL